LGGLQESAVVALRKSNGDVQRAAGEILDQVDSRREAGKDRARQRKLGLTADKSGYVDLARIETVVDFLSVERDCAVALLRLANNDIDGAASVWHESGRSAHLVLERADAISAKRPKHAPAARLPPVDEVALVTLVSSGVDRELAETALRSTAGRGSDPVEAALEWLTGDAGAAAVDAVGEGTGGSGGTGGKERSRDADREAGSEEGRSDSSDSSFASSSSSDDRTMREEEARHQEAFNTFQRELGDSLQRQELGEEHLGSMLRDELYFIEKYLGLAQSASEGAN